MDRLEAMSLLMSTLDAGSFSAAARLRDMPVGTLTRKIGQLEEHLGAVLLIRSTRKLALTDAGRRYVAGARQIIDQVDQIEREAAGEFVGPTGQLVVSAPRMFGRLAVLPIVAEFLERHPGITIDLQLLDHNVDLAAGDADVAVRIGPLPDSGLIATRLGSMRSVIAASPELLDHHGTPAEPAELASLPFIRLNIPLPGSGANGSGKTVDRSANPARLAVSSAEAAVDAATRGMGAVRVLHYQVAEAVRAGRLRLILEDHEDEAAPVHVLHASLHQLPQKTRLFIDFASVRLGAFLSLDPAGGAKGRRQG